MATKIDEIYRKHHNRKMAEYMRNRRANGFTPVHTNTRKAIFSVYTEYSLLQQIDAYTNKHQFPNRSRAVADIVRKFFEWEDGTKAL